MKSNTCEYVFKTLLMIFNTLFTICGLIFLIDGTLGLTQYKYLFSFTPGYELCIVLLSIGAFMLLIGVASIFCIPNNTKCFLVFYAIVLFILLTVLCTASTLLVARHDLFEDMLKNGFSNSINGYKENQTPVDLIQIKLQCCGLYGYNDWYNVNWTTSTYHRVPSSCCNMGTCQQQYFNLLNPKTDSFKDGCLSKIQYKIEENYILAAGIGFTASFVNLIGFILTFGLIINLRRNKYQRFY